MRVGVLGTGRMGMRHLQVLRDLGFEIVGIMDQQEASLARAGAEFEIPPARQYHDAGRLLEAAKPEAVIVSATAPGHAPLTCLAAEAGAKYILCEKPMASSLAACDRMIDTCRRHGVRLAINHQMRFMEQYRMVRRILESEEFGRWSSIAVVAGNIGLAMNGTHYFELLRWMSGEDPASVSAWLGRSGGPNPRGPQFEDCAGSVRVTTAGGRRLYMEIGADQGHGIRVIYAGRNGVLVADELDGQVHWSVRVSEHRGLSTSRYGMPAEDSTTKVAPADAVSPTCAVLEALIAGRDYPTGEDGRTAVATLVAAHISNERDHCPVSLDGLPREREFPYP